MRARRNCGCRVDAQARGGVKRAMRRVLSAGVFAGIVGMLALRRARNWGASPGEINSELPGDDLVPEPAEGTTLAVDIVAPSDRVWRWLVQIGQDRGGMYSYDWLENVIGLGIRSADRVHERWQHLAVGDRIVLVPRGWGPLPDGYGAHRGPAGAGPGDRAAPGTTRAPVECGVDVRGRTAGRDELQAAVPLSGRAPHRRRDAVGQRSAGAGNHGHDPTDAARDQAAGRNRGDRHHARRRKGMR